MSKRPKKWGKYGETWGKVWNKCHSWGKQWLWNVCFTNSRKHEKL